MNQEIKQLIQHIESLQSVIKLSQIYCPQDVQLLIKDHLKISDQIVELTKNYHEQK